MGYDLRVAQDDAVQTVDVDCRERFIDRLDRCRRVGTVGREQYLRAFFPYDLQILTVIIR